MSDDLAPLFEPDNQPLLRYGQGEIVSWDPATARGRIRWRGIELVDVPVVAGVSALGFQKGDRVALIGVDQTGKRGTTSWVVWNRILTPGEDTPDVEIRGSDLILRGGGRFLVKDADGDTRAGMQLGDGGGQIATFHKSGTAHMIAGDVTVGGTPVGQGFLLQQANGQDILNAFRSSVTGKVQIRMWAHDGTQVFLTDAEGWGLDRPYIEQPMYVQHAFGETGYGGSDWQTMWSGRMCATHPAVHADVSTWVSDSSTTGEIRLTLAGTQLGSTQTVTSTSRVFHDFGVQDISPAGLSHYAYHELALEGRVTSGTGDIHIVPYGVTKRGL